MFLWNQRICSFLVLMFSCNSKYISLESARLSSGIWISGKYSIFSLIRAVFLLPYEFLKETLNIVEDRVLAKLHTNLLLKLRFRK